MRWVPWALGIAGVLQYAVIAALQPSGYVSVDMAYLVMWLAVIGGVAVCYMSRWDCYGGGCSCCGDGCACGDCEECRPGGGHGHEHGEHGHEGHSH